MNGIMLTKETERKNEHIISIVSNDAVVEKIKAIPDNLVG